MFRALIVIILTGGTSLALTDLDSRSLFPSVVMPTVVLVSLISFAIWLVFFLNRTGLDKSGGISETQDHSPISPDDPGGLGGDGN